MRKLLPLILLAAANGCGDGASFSITTTGDAAADSDSGGSAGPDAGGGGSAAQNDAAAGTGHDDAGTSLSDAGDAQSDLDGALSDASSSDADLDDATTGDASVDVCASLTLADAGAADAGAILLASDPPAGATVHFSSQARDRQFIVKNVSNQSATLAALVTVGYSVGLSYSTMNNTCTAGSTLAPGECCGWTTRYNTVSLTANDTLSVFFSNATGPQWSLTSP